MQVSSQVRVCVPQLPQPSVTTASGTHASGGTAQADNAPQAQSAPQVRVCTPQSPHGTVSTSSGVQAPSLWHTASSAHRPSALHELSLKPQLPHAMVRTLSTAGSH